VAKEDSTLGSPDSKMLRLEGRASSAARREEAGVAHRMGAPIAPSRWSSAPIIGSSRDGLPELSLARGNTLARKREAMPKAPPEGRSTNRSTEVVLVFVLGLGSVIKLKLDSRSKCANPAPPPRTNILSIKRPHLVSGSAPGRIRALGDADAPHWLPICPL